MAADIGSSRALPPVIPEQVSTSRDNRHHPMKLPREVPPASFSALGLVCSSKTMAGRESRKYSLAYESSLYVGSVPKVLLDHRRSSNSKQSVGISARLSSCDELPRPTDSSSRCSWLVATKLHLPTQERLVGRGMTFRSSSKLQATARTQRGRGRPRWSVPSRHLCGCSSTGVPHARKLDTEPVGVAQEFR